MRVLATRIGMAGLALAGLCATGVGSGPATAATSYYLPMGTPVQLSTRTDINSRDNRAGSRFTLEVAEPVRARGQTVIPAGAIAVGEVVRSDPSSNFGKAGRIEARLLYIDTPERRIAIDGHKAGRGRDGTVGATAATVAFGIIGGVLVRGTTGRVAPGTTVVGYLREDLPFIGEAPTDAEPMIRAEADPSQVAAR